MERLIVSFLAIAFLYIEIWPKIIDRLRKDGIIKEEE